MGLCFSVTEDCLVPICCGLYELLSGVLLILPDVMLEDVMDRLIQADTLLVLVNHPSPAVQQEVIKVRANTKYVALIWKNKYMCTLKFEYIYSNRPEILFYS